MSSRPRYFGLMATDQDHQDHADGASCHDYGIAAREAGLVWLHEHAEEHLDFASLHEYERSGR
jgi:hypothetical protein